MIRIALAYLALVVLMCGMIIYDPLDWVLGNGSDVATVADPAPTDDGAEAAVIAALASQAPPAQTEDVSTASVAEPVQDTPQLRVNNADLNATTAAILADLRSGVGAAVAEDVSALAPAAPAPDDALTAMSASVLAGLRGAKGEVAAAETGPVTLQTLVSQALREGQSDAFIDALVNEAAGAGAVSVPAMLVTSDGKVDTAVLLSALVAKSQEDDMVGEGDASDPTEIVPGGTAAFVAQDKDITYTVRGGDSLGSLALRFYGDADFYPAIYNANRKILLTPNSLQAGMTLLIPARSSL